MLTQSFIHLPHVGRVTESEIWDAGIGDWDDFASASELPARIRGRGERLRALVRRSRERYERRNTGYFNGVLPIKERWRMYADFRDKAAFLDIETTGLSAENGIITLIGVLDGDGYTAYVYDENLADFREALERYELIVTFNGAAFDLPFIEHHFGRIFGGVAHLDLRFPLKRAGFSGGLKAIEAQAQVGRPSALSALNGYDAVRLWRLWQRGSDEARQTLVRYNAEDVASLPALAEIVYNRLAERLPIRAKRLAPSHRHNIDLPYDMGVIERLKHMNTHVGRAL